MDLTSIIIDDDLVQRQLIKGFIEETGFVKLLCDFGNPLEAINFLETNSPDLIFLDIEMPKMNGLEFLQTLRYKPKVILCTAKEQYAVKSYSYEIVDYLLKPIKYVDFLKATLKVKNQLFNQGNIGGILQNEIFVKTNTSIERIVLNDILFIKAAVDYIQIVTSANKYLVNTNMNQIINKLPSFDFLRIHRSYIVRLDKIEKIDGNVIQIKGNLIRISKSYKDELIRRIDPI